MTKALGFILLRMIDTASSLGNRAAGFEYAEREAIQKENGPAAPVHPRMAGPFAGKIRWKTRRPLG